jgi:hypothetical protein
MTKLKYYRTYRGSFLPMIFLFLFVLYSESGNSQELWKDDPEKVEVKGPSYNQQVYVKSSRGDLIVTNFRKWELIRSLFVSPDEKKLLVYHKPDKGKSFVISLYDLEKNKLIAEAKPGWSCYGVRWSENYIIYEWATSGGGHRLEYRDYNLKVIRVINSYRWFFDVDSDFVIALPHYSAESGEINIYRYSDGAQIKTTNFTEKLGESYICTDCKKIGDKKYMLTVEKLISGTTVEVELDL